MLEKHDVWEFFVGAETLEAFQQNIVKSVYLNPLMPEDIKKEINQVEKLLIHSFYEYEFIDIALTQAIFALEKALKIKNEELGYPLKEKALFHELLDWFLNNNYFETDSIDILNQLRTIRNKKAHQKEKSLGGVVFISKVHDVIDLLNDLYEELVLRQARKDIRKSLNEKLIDFAKEGIILADNNGSTIISHANVIFVDNKSTDIIYHIGLIPIFDPTSYKDEHSAKPQTIILRLKNLTIGKDEVTAQHHGEIVTIKVIDNKNKSKFDQWKLEINSLPNFPMIFYLATEPWEKYYKKSIREFHRTEVVI